MPLINPATIGITASRMNAGKKHKPKGKTLFTATDLIRFNFSVSIELCNTNSTSANWSVIGLPECRDVINASEMDRQLELAIVISSRPRESGKPTRN